LCFTFPGKVKKKRDVKKRKVRGGTAKIGNTSTLRKVEKQKGMATRLCKNAPKD
jgi:hypothetical protein